MSTSLSLLISAETATLFFVEVRDTFHLTKRFLFFFFLRVFFFFFFYNKVVRLKVVVGVFPKSGNMFPSKGCRLGVIVLRGAPVL